MASSVTLHDLDTIDARINDTAERIRQQRLELSRRTTAISSNTALSDLQNKLASLYVEKRATLAALEHKRGVQAIPAERMCSYPGCQQRATGAGFCKAHRNPNLGQGQHQEFSEAENRLLTELHRAGKNSKEIGEALGRTGVQVRNRLRMINSWNMRTGVL